MVKSAILMTPHQHGCGVKVTWVKLLYPWKINFMTLYLEFLVSILMYYSIYIEMNE